ncbi:MAG: hypothetical protein EOP06_22835 [Proteobacteria bacterium]|nr:MAG: hypothetical protein EOP06_22835 [Pseudomonadota bacterium]
MVALQRDLAMEVRHILRHFHYENALPTLPHRLDITTGSMIQPKVERQVEAIALTAFVWTGRKTIAYYIVKNAGQCNLFRGLVSNTGSENPFRLSIGLTTTPDQLPSHQKISVEHLQVILAAMRKLQDS